MSWETVPATFNLVDDDGNPARAVLCPFCSGQLTLGYVARPDGPRQTSPAAIHGTIGDGRTGCETFDRLDVLPFLEIALPLLIRRAALDAAATFGRRGRA